MVDAPYRVADLLLRPREGMFAGAASAALMLLVVRVLQSVSPLDLSSALEQTARQLAPDSLLAGSDLGLVGALLHVAVGALLGALYAVCQERAPIRGLVAVGVFYGLMIWVGAAIVLGWAMRDLRGTVRSGWWLIACIVYGMSLSLASVAASRARPGEATVEPVD